MLPQALVCGREIVGTPFTCMTTNLIVDCRFNGTWVGSVSRVFILRAEAVVLPRFGDVTGVAGQSLLMGSLSSFCCEVNWLVWQANICTYLQWSTNAWIISCYCMNYLHSRLITWIMNCCIAWGSENSVFHYLDLQSPNWAGLVLGGGCWGFSPST